MSETRRGLGLLGIALVITGVWSLLDLPKLAFPHGHFSLRNLLIGLGTCVAVALMGALLAKWAFKKTRP